MMQVVRYGAALIVFAAIAVGAYVFLPASFGNVAPKHGGGDDHGHGHGHTENAAILNDTKLSAAGIELEKAGPAVLRETLRINGLLLANQEATVQVTPRFPGVVREIRKRVGDSVDKDEVLARVESNQSLTTYELRAPLAGTIIERNVSLGEYVSDQKPAFIVTDLSAIWADFSIPRRDLRRVKIGDTIVLDPDDGGDPIEAKVSYLSPIGTTDTQSGLARAVVPNTSGRLRPGLFATGRLVLEQKPVSIAIKLNALQTLEGRTVVFVRNEDKFEPRDVELGQRDSESAEVLFGLEEGDVYAAKNSFVIKAELAKATAAHEH